MSWNRCSTCRSCLLRCERLHRGSWQTCGAAGVAFDQRPGRGSVAHGSGLGDAEYGRYVAGVAAGGCFLAIQSPGDQQRELGQRHPLIVDGPARPDHLSARALEYEGLTFMEEYSIRHPHSTEPFTI